jgi:hypothetical protein
MRPIVPRLSRAFLLALVALSGCQPTRTPVEGTVLLDGKPLERGGLDFVPLDPTPQNRARISCRVENGVYKVEEDRGPFPGRYRVEAFAQRIKGKMSNGEGGEYVAYEHVALPKYGDKSELVVDVVSGENKLDFNLTN